MLFILQYGFQVRRFLTEIQFQFANCLDLATEISFEEARIERQELGGGMLNSSHLQVFSLDILHRVIERQSYPLYDLFFQKS